MSPSKSKPLKRVFEKYKPQGLFSAMATQEFLGLKTFKKILAPSLDQKCCWSLLKQLLPLIFCSESYLVKLFLIYISRQ